MQAIPEPPKILAKFHVSDTIRTVVAIAGQLASSGEIGPAEIFRAALQHGSQSESSSARWLYNLLSQDSSVAEIASPGGPSGPDGDRQTDFESPELSAEATEVFEEATRVRQRTGGRDSFIGLRHVLFASVVVPESRPMIDSELRRYGRDSQWLKTEIVPFLHESLEPGESWEEWLRILEEDKSAAQEPVSSQAEDRSKATPAYQERVPTLSDDPSKIDLLGRRHFAEVIAQRIEEVERGWFGWRKRKDQGAFMLLIDGPWGSGKSSVLNLLEACLKEEKNSKRVFVKFNAWQNQRTRPPWWTLIRALYVQSMEQADSRARLWRKWWIWRLQNDWLPPLLGVIFLAFAIPVITDLLKHAGKPVEWETPVKIVSGILAVWGAVYAYSRSLIVGSERAATTLTEMRSDPLQPIVALFNSLIKVIDGPVIVFIDDLDRCAIEYVIELLEGIQTLLRQVPLIYVVAADRKWICSSFEKTYTDFGPSIGEPGRPIGYLFLDKVFQVSMSLPMITGELRKSFWETILAGPPKETGKAAQKQAEANANERVRDLHTQEELAAAVAHAGSDPVEQMAIRGAAAKQITSEEARSVTEHRLRRFSVLLEPNPRSMKRLVNAYGLHQATHFLEGKENIPPEVLARWTIIELRWPLLAECLSQKPECSELLGSELQAIKRRVPKNLEGLFTSREVVDVFKGHVELGPPLDSAMIARIVGRA